MNWLLATSFAVLFSCPAAASILYTVAPAGPGAGANDWVYSYTVANDGAVPIKEFTIWFDFNLTARLSVVASPSSWDTIAIQPDAQIPADGFMDALSAGSGLALGGVASGWAVGFTYFGLGTPGSQNFSIVDPITFATISTGQTVASAVPEPTQSVLIAIGATFLLLVVRRRGIVSAPDSGAQNPLLYRQHVPVLDASSWIRLS